VRAYTAQLQLAGAWRAAGPGCQGASLPCAAGALHVAQIQLVPVQEPVPLCAGVVWCGVVWGGWIGAGALEAA